MSEIRLPFSDADSDETRQAMGISSWAVMDTEDIDCFEEVRCFCSPIECEHCGKNWTCPPALGDIDTCEDKLSGYENALFFSSVYPRNGLEDEEGTAAGREAFQKVLDAVAEKAGADTLLLSNEPCRRCIPCTYPEKCLHPEKMFPVLEGYGIMVSALCRDSGITYYNGDNSVTFFGLLCY